MKVEISIEDKEINRFIRNIQKYEKKKLHELERLVINAGLTIHREARMDILVDTGRARSATLINWIREKGNVVGCVVKTDVDYAIYIERRKPYLYKSFAKERVKFVRDIKRLISRP